MALGVVRDSERLLEMMAYEAWGGGRGLDAASVMAESLIDVGVEEVGRDWS